MAASFTLPPDDNLPVNKLASCFNATSATYKYYWFLSIIEEIEKGKTIIPKRDLFSGMISKAWYTVNYFHINFGLNDLLQNRIRLIRDEEK